MDFVSASRSARFLSVLAVCSFAIACGGPAASDAGDVLGSDSADSTMPTDGADANDSSMDALDATDASTDAGVDVGDDAIDATPDSADANDGGGTVSLTAMVTVGSIGQNCMPIVAPDPLSVSGSVDVSNTGTATIGPITSTSGAILSESGMEIATFAIDPISIAAIGPGATGSATFTKTSGTLMPANGCETVPCNATVRVAIDLSGPNIPSGARAISAISRVECAL
jgi:hypothetical protein